MARGGVDVFFMTWQIIAFLINEIIKERKKVEQVKSGESRRSLKQFRVCPVILRWYFVPGNHQNTPIQTHIDHGGSYSFAAIRASDSFIEAPSPPNSFSTKCQRFSLTGSMFILIEFLPLGCGVRRRTAAAATTAAAAGTLSYSATVAVSPHCVQLNFILQLSAKTPSCLFYCLIPECTGLHGIQIQIFC